MGCLRRDADLVIVDQAAARHRKPAGTAGTRSQGAPGGWLEWGGSWRAWIGCSCAYLLPDDLEGLLVPGFELDPLLPPRLEGIEMVAPALMLCGLLMPFEEAN